MSHPGEIIYVEIERLPVLSDGDSAPIKRYFVSAVDGELHILFGIWDGDDHIAALVAAAEFGAPVFDATEAVR